MPAEKSSLKDLEKLHEGKAAENKRRLQPGDASVAAMAAAGEESGKDTLEFPCMSCQGCTDAEPNCFRGLDIFFFPLYSVYCC